MGTEQPTPSPRVASILLVEDDEDARDAVAHVLRDRPVALLFAVDGEQALGALRSDDYDLVILDLDLPRVHGLEVLRRRPSSDVPIVAFSSAATDATFDEARRLGAAACYRKPVSMANLRETLHEMLEQWARAPMPDGTRPQAAIRAVAHDD